MAITSGKRTNPQHSAATAEHYTPEIVVSAARYVLGGVIDLDPASNAFANRIVMATHYYTKDDNGLLLPWHGNVFVNPPGSCGGEICKRKRGCGCKLPFRFWEKAIEEYTEGRAENIFWVGFSLEQLLQFQKADLHPMRLPWCIPKKRMRFLDAFGDPGNSPTHGNYLCLLSSDSTVRARFSERLPLIGETGGC